MKREIKFKAKRLDGKGWVEGSLIRSTTGIKERAYIVDNFSSMSDYSVIGVDSSTVCQFTGLKDYEGKEIWEGDIVERKMYDLYKGIIEAKGVIEYIEGSFCVMIDNIPYALYCKNVRITGNKFDKNK